ncbi:hypothetical protein E3P92_01580 [Wallemia ichthyophaga]|uniref:Dolichyl-diphosphooligosaccharide--protein glycosyltransferase subunit 2 n=1 Tax=Wallemia ichthyophaga (strain EXF-994 / CBS 113033) TaxID=1299270 RepID=R9AMU3_WALI9|nr:Dolichyl-diphosphooligosaccharide--protein glycosyltransferase subunit 2 [Wallemia ichthyophaga EXF-994]EOR01416.1 Dolichyl-diphosphooligosaccharide--protein glycosyltransferase subunit 2 [Wallemia ichthyophaga EXF-994]TIB15778.1 hypothetical protein E3P92_01580 [Wallemia ichthyophaga]TIB35440.1 hypothetical protein E3P84_01429 [Wallemia ichthyophaga]TIB42206.1 hypothetical protein E3P83_01378 [Wallemia ichthyophaga]
MKFILVAIAALIANTVATIDLVKTRIHGVDELGSDVHHSSFGSSVQLERDANVQYTFYTAADGDTVTPHKSIISFIDYATGQYWEDVVSIRDSDGRGRYTLRTVKFPLKASNCLVRLFVAANGESSAFDIGTLSFSEDAAAETTTESKTPEKSILAPLPEITHTFKTEPKHTPLAISGLAAIFINGLPLLVLLGAISYIPLNLRQSHSNLAFIGTIIAFEGLLLTYWVKLTLFQFIPFAVLNGLALFVSGNRALRVLKKRREVA